MDIATKHCTKCFVEKEITEFHRDKTNRDGHRSVCKQCIFIYQKQYRKDNYELLKERDKLRNQMPERKDYLRIHSKEYYETHKEETKV